VLLGRGADLAAEFEPERIARRFGEMSEAEATDLGSLTRELNSGLDRLLSRCQEKP
jgi:hypothetical protein